MLAWQTQIAAKTIKQKRNCIVIGWEFWCPTAAHLGTASASSPAAKSLCQDDSSMQCAFLLDFFLLLSDSESSSSCGEAAKKREKTSAKKTSWVSPSDCPYGYREWPHAISWNVIYNIEYHESIKHHAAHGITCRRAVLWLGFGGLGSSGLRGTTWQWFITAAVGFQRFFFHKICRGKWLGHISNGYIISIHIIYFLTLTHVSHNTSLLQVGFMLKFVRTKALLRLINGYSQETKWHCTHVSYT